MKLIETMTRVRRREGHCECDMLSSDDNCYSVLWYAYCRTATIYGSCHCLSQVIGGDRPPFPDAASIEPALPEASQLMELAGSCWAHDQGRRPPMRQVVEQLRTLLVGVKQRAREERVAAMAAQERVATVAQTQVQVQAQAQRGNEERNAPTAAQAHAQQGREERMAAAVAQAQRAREERVAASVAQARSDELAAMQLLLN